MCWRVGEGSSSPREGAAWQGQGAGGGGGVQVCVGARAWGSSLTDVGGEGLQRGVVAHHARQLGVLLHRRRLHHLELLQRVAGQQARVGGQHPQEHLQRRLGQVDAAAAADPSRGRRRGRSLQAVHGGGRWLG
jgi:hypothetical protein